MEHKPDATIDLTGRIMWYNPWPVDEDFRYRQPTEDEKEEIYGIYGQALKETFLAFEKEGGDTELLIQYLNQHVPSEAYKVEQAVLLDSQRWYTNEFYFYFIMFTKKVLDDFNWHYSEGPGIQLSEHHKIYEIGHLRYTPFGKEEKDVTNSVIISINSYIRKNIKDTTDIHQWLDILAQHKTSLTYSKDISTLENYWVCSEFIFFLYEFAKIITNNNNILNISYDSVSTYNLRFFSFMPERIAIDSLKMLINRSGKMFKVNTKLIHSTLIEVAIVRKNNFNFKKMHWYQKSINTVVNRLITGAYVGMLKNAFNIKEKPEITFLTTLDDSECVFSISWKKEKPSFYLISVFLLIATCIGALFVPLSGFNWIKYCIASFAVPTITLLFFLKKYSREIREKLRLERHLIESNRENLKRLDKLEILSEELIQEKEELENKVSDRTKKLRKANERLKELDKIKSNFFDNISHELKTPLTLIAAPLDSILKRHYGTSIKHDNQLFTIMQNNCKRLIQMINMQLHYSKLKQGEMKLNKSPVDMITFAKAQFMLFEQQALEKKISTQFIHPVSEKIMATIDIALFEMVLANLLSNACKFSTPECTISLEVKFSRESGKIYIIVTDTGIGIPKEKQQYIFERFHQVETSLKRNHEGIGIGLSLAKEIVELHGGNIYVESELGNGAAFTIELPFSTHINNPAGEEKEIVIDNSKPEENRKSHEVKMSPVSQIDADHAQNNSRKREILLVEDNKEMAMYIKLILENSYKVTTAKNGAEALSLLKSASCSPALIISDIMMPIMDGYTFLSEFLKQEHTSLIPFIFLTARGSQEDKIKGVKSGAIDYITKPFNQEELLFRINRLLDYYEKRDREIIENMKSKLHATLADFTKTHDETSVEIREDFFTSHHITRREKEIIYCVLEGLQDKEIAAELDIATRTVSKHLANIYEKLQVANRLELTTMILKK